MSDNENFKFLKKTTYNVYENSQIIRKYRVKEGVHIGKIAYIIVKRYKDGNKKYKIKYGD